MIRSLSCSLLILLSPGPICNAGTDEFSERLRDYVGLAADYDDSKASLLYQAGVQIADTYFRTLDNSERAQLDLQLTAVLKANLDLKVLWIPLGDAFQKKALDLAKNHRAEVRKIRSMSGLIAGAAGFVVSLGLMHFKIVLPQATSAEKVIVSSAASLLGGAFGYFLIGPLWADIALPVDPLVQSAEEFLNRYPHGSEFLTESSQSPLELEIESLWDSRNPD